MTILKAPFSGKPKANMSHFQFIPPGNKHNPCKMPKGKEEELTSWNTVQDRIRECLEPDFNKLRPKWVFRGLESSGYHLTTTLQRTGGDINHIRDVENPLFRNFKKYAHRDIEKQEPDLHWLAVAQHHRLPTRLLDWTVSPTVALHFATCNLDKLDDDSALWAVNFDKTNKLLPCELRNILTDQRAKFLTVNLMNDHQLRTLEDLSALGSDYVLFFEPSAIDDRIVNQYAVFSLMPSCETVMCDWLESHPELYKKYILKRDVKREIRDRLDQMNVTERVLFPGLDGLADWLKRYYFYRSP